MNIARIFANAFARRLAYVAVAALLLWVGIGKAEAAICTIPSGPGACSQGKAFTAAAPYPAAQQQCVGIVGPNARITLLSPTQTINTPTRGYYIPKANCHNGTSSTVVTVMSGDAEYYDGQMCSMRPHYAAGIIPSGNSSPPKRCDGGCEMQLETGGQSVKMDTRDNSIRLGIGNMVATGATCVVTATTPTREPMKQEYCSEVEGGGYQVCPQKDGKMCVKSLSTGRKYCGNNDYPTVSTDPNRTESVAISGNNPLPGISPPTPAPRTGEAWTNHSTTTTTTTTSTTTTINNTNIYNNGGTPGTAQPPVSGDGSDNPGEGEGEDDEEEGGTVSGGEGCEAPPSCSGGDMVLCASLLQSWKLRCETGDLTGNPSLGEIDDALSSGMGDGPDFSGQPGGASGTWQPGASGDWQEVEDDESAIEFDDSGFLGARSCPIAPAVSVSGAALPFTFQPICDLLISLSNIILGLAYFIGLKIFLGART